MELLQDLKQGKTSVSELGETLTKNSMAIVVHQKQKSRQCSDLWLQPLILIPTHLYSEIYRPRRGTA